MTGSVTKTYTTSNRFFMLPDGDFDVIDAVYVSPGATGSFGLHIYHSLIDRVQPEQHLKDDKPQLCFLGMFNMNLLCYMYPFGVTHISKDNDEEVTYTVKGKKYPTIEQLKHFEDIYWEHQPLMVKMLHKPPKATSVKELINREIMVPVVSCGKLNYLFYKQGYCCLLFCFDE